MHEMAYVAPRALMNENITPAMTTNSTPRPRSLLDCDGPYALRDMPLQAKALKSATCHLARDHGVDVTLIGGDGPRLLELHLAAHGFDTGTSYPASWLPWRVRSLPHDLMKQQGQTPLHR